MKYLAIAVGIGMAVFTAVSIAYADTWSYFVLANVGPISVSTFDLLFAAAAGLWLLANAVRLGPEREPMNRLVLSLCWAYIGYQLFIVFPAAVLLHDLRPVDVVRLIEVRLALLLIPVTYSIVLRYWKPSVLVAILDAAAVALVVYVIYNYAAHGVHGYVESGVLRLRAVWGGGILLFGWLLLTSPLLLADERLAAGDGRSGSCGSRSRERAIRSARLRDQLHRRGPGGARREQTCPDRARPRRRRERRSLLRILAAGAPERRLLGHDRHQPLLRPDGPGSRIRSTLGLAYFEQHPLGDYVWNRAFYSVNLGSAGFVPHNFVVQLLVTQGLIASGLYFAIIGLAVFIAWRNRRDRLSSVMLAYLVFYFTFCLLNANVDLRENVSLFFITVAIVLYQNREGPPASGGARGCR